jgi:GntR family transcriptional regulator/MocR family aminotransferase
MPTLIVETNVGLMVGSVAVSLKGPFLINMPYHLQASPVLPPHRIEAERQSLLQRGGDFNLWELDRDSAVPLGRQIYARLRDAILAGTLRPTTRLPSSRNLAVLLRVARSTVVATYEQLLAEGYLSGRTGSGTFVSSDLPDQRPIEAVRSAVEKASKPATSDFAGSIETFVRATAQREALPFTLGRCRFDARSADCWRRLTQRTLRNFAPTHLGYSDPRGLADLRELICDYLRAARAVRCEPWQIIVTTGTQQAIDLAIRTLLAEGDEAWVEDPGYAMTHQALSAAKVKIRPIAVDRQGIDVGAGIINAPRARAAFITPSHQHPLGVVLSMARRLELLAWARKADAYIIEDDYDSDFRYVNRPIASLQGLDDHGRVIYAGTLNKILFPGIRIGYLVIPADLVRAFVATRHIIDRHPQSLTQPVLAEFMRGGHFVTHLRRTRQCYHEQRDHLVSELQRRLGTLIEAESPDQGMHLVAFLRPGLSDVQVENAARREGVVVRAMSPLYRIAPKRQALMLGFSGYPCEMIPPAVARLARAIGRVE